MTTTTAEAVLALLEKESAPAPILNRWPHAAQAIVIPPALLKVRGVVDARTFDVARGAHLLWGEVRVLPVPPSDEPLDIVLSRSPIPSPVIGLQGLLVAILKGGDVLARVERERDRLNALIRECW